MRSQMVRQEVEGIRWGLLHLDWKGREHEAVSNLQSRKELSYLRTSYPLFQCASYLRPTQRRTAFLPSVRPISTKTDQDRAAVPFKQHLVSKRWRSRLEASSTRDEQQITPQRNEQHLTSQRDVNKYLAPALSLASMACALLKNVAGYFPIQRSEAVNVVTMTSLCAYELLATLGVSYLALQRLRGSGTAAKVAIGIATFAAGVMWFYEFLVVSTWNEFASAGALSQMIRLIGSSIISVPFFLPLIRRIRDLWYTNSVSSDESKQRGVAAVIIFSIVSIVVCIGNFIDLVLLWSEAIFLNGKVPVPEGVSINVTVEEFTSHLTYIRLVRLVQKIIFLVGTLALGFFGKKTAANNVLLYGMQILLTAWFNLCVSPKTHMIL